MSRQAVLELFGNLSIQDALFRKVRGMTLAELKAFKSRPTRVQLVAGNVLILPAGSIVMERSVGGQPSYGFRLPYLSFGQAEVFNSAFDHTKTTWPRHPHMPQMESMRKIYNDKPQA